MKSLMDVIKALLKINGVLALLTLSVVMMVREKQPKTTTDNFKFHAEIQSMNLEEPTKNAENSQKIANLEEKFQQKDQKIQQLQRQLAAYQQRQTAQEKASKTETKANLDKKPSQDSLYAVKTQLNPKYSPVAPVAQNPSPVKSSQRTENRPSKNRFSESPVSLSPKTEIKSNLEQTSAVKKPEKSVISNIGMSSIPQSFSQTTLTKSETQKPVSDRSKQNSQDKKTRSVSEKSETKPILQKPVSEQLKQDYEPKKPTDQAIHLANDLGVGLLVADKQKHIKYGTRNYKKVQTAIGSLRQGSSTTLEQAARQSGLKTSILAQVAKWGQDRPGSFESDNQISLAESK